MVVPAVSSTCPLTLLTQVLFTWFLLVAGEFALSVECRNGTTFYFRGREKVTSSRFFRVTISTVSCWWAPCSQSVSRWGSVACSVSIRSQKGSWVLRQGGSGPELRDTRSDATFSM